MAAKANIKKITYIHQYFKTPKEGGAIRSWYIATEMVMAGYEVDMITTSSDSQYRIEMIDGIRVHYYPIPYDNSFSFLKRVKAFFAFNKTVKEHINSHPKPQLLYITSTPLTVGKIGIWANKKFGIPFVFEVRDLWPEAPIQMGIVRPNILQKYLYKVEKNIYSQASQIIALSPGIKTYISKIVSSKKVHIISNMSDIDFYTRETDRTKIFKKYKLKDIPTIGYFGTIGRANHLEYLIDIIAKSKLEMQFVILGSGSELYRIKELAKQKSIDGNMLFLPSSSKETLRELQSICHFTYCSFKKIPVLETNSPNKFFDSLAAGVPVIVNTRGWLKELVEKNCCGVYLDPEEPFNFDKLIQPLLESFTYDEYSIRAKKLAYNFDRKKLASEVISIVSKFF